LAISSRAASARSEYPECEGGIRPVRGAEQGFFKRDELLGVQIEDGLIKVCMPYCEVPAEMAS